MSTGTRPGAAPDGGGAADAVLVLKRVVKTYPVAVDRERRVLDGVDLELAPGTSTALIGRSGSGKSTLLHLAAGIATPTSGNITLAGRDIGAAAEKERTVLRRRLVGLVFQFFHLLPHLTVLENVLLPAWIAGDPAEASDERARSLLGQVELAERCGDAVGRLSGGERQRVAICRALLRRPPLVLADEPTGSLDDAAGARVMELLLELVRREQATLLFVTHSRELARAADAMWRLHGGRLEAGASP